MPYNVVRLPLDPTGQNVNNLIQDEPHTLSDKQIRAISPTYGPFFAESVIVRESDGTLLNRGEHYQIVELHQEATVKFGKEISTVILIIDTNVSNEVLVTYQALGGHYAHDDVSIANLYEAVINDNRPVSWRNVLNKPLEFPPANHRHLLEDVYGFEPVVDVLERIKNAITLGQAEIVFEVIKRFFSTRIVDIRKKFDGELPKLINFDDMLYYLSAKKILNKIRCESVLDNYPLGSVITIVIDDKGFDYTQPLKWYMITTSGKADFLDVYEGQYIVQNTEYNEIRFYLPTLLSEPYDRSFYFVLKQEEEDLDYVAISYKIKFEQPVTNDTITPKLLQYKGQLDAIDLDVFRDSLDPNSPDYDEALIYAWLMS